MSGQEIAIRRMLDADRAGALAVIEASLGRRPDSRNGAFFDWKHAENSFGPSPAWVALDGDRVVGLRVLMRWEFDTPSGPARAVRAVDTATHPDYQGRGIFSALTRRAVAELRDEGVDFVFNTPNDKSRPGYLKMGWQQVGRLPTGIRPRGATSLPRIAAARVPSDMWSVASGAGEPALDVLADEADVGRLLTSLPRPDGVVTHRSPAYLRWRYGFEPLHYRAVLAGSALADGVLLFRVRNRGNARELVVADLLLPDPTAGAVRHVISAALKSTRADYALGLRTVPTTGLIPLPGQGPIVTWRALASDTMPELSEWKLSLGDVELF